VRIALYACGGEHDRSEAQTPLGLRYLVSNCTGADIRIETDRERLNDYDLIGLGAPVAGLREAVEILASAKRPVIVGGHGTLWEGLAKYPFAHIVIGEGERALQRIIDGNAPRVLREPLIEDVDSIAFPDRSGMEGNTTVRILTSRGCPWHCAFCSSSAFWGSTRFHSPGYFMAELAEAMRIQPKAKHLYILDDLFVANEKRFYEIAELYLAAGYHKRLTVASYIRSNTFNRALGLKLKEMNFVNARFGGESASNRVLALLGKHTTVEDHQRTIDLCNEIGLPVTAAWMFKIPGETPEDARATVEFIERNKDKCGNGGRYTFRAFPGTPMYRGENPLTDEMDFRWWGDPRKAIGGAA